LAAQDGGRPEPQPTHRNVPYGPHERNVVDFYQADSDAPTPVLVYFHGGGFRNGSKDRINAGLYRLCIDGGISFAAANYRLSQHAPYPAQMHDSARAIQLLRSNAGDWNIDANRLAAFGGSAGAGISLWLAFHDDMADPASDDPIARESTRLACAVGLQAQSTYDPREIEQIVPGRAYNHPALKQLFALPLDWQWEANEVSETLSAQLRDASPIMHLTKDDPPVFVYHRKAQDVPGDIHHANFGRVLKKEMDHLGIECVHRMSTEFDNAQAQNEAIFEFVKKHLLRAPRSATSNAAASAHLMLAQRSRAANDDGSSASHEVTTNVKWDPKKMAIIICDMWDDHTCQGAASRVAEMAPAVQRTAEAARQQGALIIHAPSGTMSRYADTPQRRRASDAPFTKAPVEIKWNHWEPSREGEPLSFIRSGGCGCPEPCPGWVPDETGQRRWQGGKVPWTRQIETIETSAEDAISDNGQEIYNLLQQRGVDNVILMGVHTNICVSGRPFGLRQMVYLGKNVILCRDLTDSLFQSVSPEFDHFRGTELIVEHIEKHLCPTITSASITGQPEFRFKADAASDRVQ
jgi:acetyl esterase/lipase/nicotinamidase-related amidase